MNNEIKQMNLLQIILYHLLPGLPILLLAIVFSNPAWGFGLNILLAIMFAVIIGLVPVQLLIIAVFANRQNIKFKEAILYKEKIKPLKFISWALPCFFASVLLFVSISIFEHRLWENFALIPDWLKITNFVMEDYSTNILLLTAVLNILINGILGPVTEEIYFRGFLLPRMENMGKAAHLVSSLLFSLYHLFSPWEIITRTIMYLPIAYAVWRTKNYYIAVAVHCTLNMIGCIGMLVGILLM